VKKELWGGELWEDGYFARTVGDEVTAEVIRNYIRYHREQEKSPKQLENCFKMPRPVGGEVHWQSFTHLVKDGVRGKRYVAFTVCFVTY